MDEKNLDEKIEKKKADLERNLKRLRTLKDVRPAFMDEYESLEKELEILYDEYLVKFRIQSYLEQQLDEYNLSEQEKFEESARTMQMTIKKMKDQEKERSGNPFMDDDEMMMSADSDQSDDQIEKKTNGNKASKNLQQQKMQAKQKVNQGKNFGTMNADISDGSEEDDDEDDEDDEDGLDDDDDDDEEDEDDDLNDDDEVNIQSTQHKGKSNGKGRGGAGAVAKEESDSDF